MTDTPLQDSPNIAPSVVHVVGQDIAIVAYAHPTAFPHGVDVIAIAPGGIKPLGQSHVPPGAMLAVIPPGMADEILRQMKAARVVAPGAVRAPGTPGA